MDHVAIAEDRRPQATTTDKPAFVFGGVGYLMSKWLNGDGPKMEKMLMDWNNSPSPASLRDLPRKQACVDSANRFAVK
jgi:hypothetical protein